MTRRVDLEDVKDQNTDLKSELADLKARLAASKPPASLNALNPQIADDGAPRAARRDAADALRAHVEIDPAIHDDPATAAWWHDHRDQLVWQAARHRFAAPAGG
ncbi:MAG TPA: hypothetical protein VHT91_41160 [Kofleriaceae bacterium]|nr:hypothetical protein [Kofleriaceae bacterium]